MLSVNTNAPSLFLQRNIAQSQTSIDTALQRISTGLRINSAKDDAAGLAISTRFTTQIQGLLQAGRNTNDGVSIAQVGEAGLSGITTNLQRIRELAVQAGNSTLDAASRDALDVEVRQLLSEIDRVASNTDFNGYQVLNGSLGNVTLQVGPDVGDTLGLTVSSGVKSTQIGQIALATGDTAVTVDPLNSFDLQIAIGSESGAYAAASSDYADDGGRTADSAFAKAAAIDAADITGLQVYAQTDDVTYEFGDVVDDVLNPDATYTLTINGVDIYAAQAVTADIAAEDIADAINAERSSTGVFAVYDSGAGTLTLSVQNTSGDNDGRNISVVQSFQAGGLGGKATGGIDTNANPADSDEVSETNRGKITLGAPDTITLSGDDVGKIGFSSGTINTDSQTLSSISLDSVTDANTAVIRIDSSLQSVSTLRSYFGSTLGRLDSVINNLDSSAFNLQQARSRIQDADYAREVASLTRAQLLRDAGISLLAQANLDPRQALQLLGTGSLDFGQ